MIANEPFFCESGICCDPGVLGDRGPEISDEELKKFDEFLRSWDMGATATPNCERVRKGEPVRDFTERRNGSPKRRIFPEDSQKLVGDMAFFTAVVFIVFEIFMHLWRFHIKR